jgi:large subunit ribosomal protein L24
MKNGKVHVKTGDTVVLLTGKYDEKMHAKSGIRKTGKVLEVSRKEGKVIVEGMNMITKHVKPKRQGEPGGIVRAEAPIYACKLQVVCPKCSKPTRIGHKIDKDGVKKRVCRKCEAVFE